MVDLDSIDDGLRRWWADHVFTTTVIGGVLVLGITVLVVNEVVRFVQINARSRATAAQAGIVMSQAARATKAVCAAQDGSGELDAAVGEVRNYLLMLLIAAPVFIDASLARSFLERAQNLAAVLSSSLAVAANSRDAPSTSRARLDDAMERVRTASAPLLKSLNSEQRAAVGAGEAAASPS